LITKKIRGVKRAIKQVGYWKDYSKELSIERLKENLYAHAKIYVSPYHWARISSTNSEIPEPRGKIRKIIFSGLLDIYDAWKNQLKNLGEPYYLKIWISEPKFSDSQVVCAIGDKIEYYENLFMETESEIPFPVEKFANEKDRINKMEWESFYDEDLLCENDLGDPGDWKNIEDYKAQKRWYHQKLKKSHRTVILDPPDNGVDELYLFKKGLIWVGH
jgi:hypothetical protein